MEEYRTHLKRKDFLDLITTYETNGTTTWANFYSTPATHSKKVIELTSSDFVYGTLRITHPCLLKLTSDIEFNPNRPTTWLDSSDAVTSVFTSAVKLDPSRALDWKPIAASSTNTADYLTGDIALSYKLGFFAAIAVECSDVIIDLNGYTLTQHKEHYVQQRFFSAIELADQAFIPGDGYASFGKTINSANNCLIMNGKIGRSSQYGIHGNNCSDIFLENLSISDYEVAAIALNGSHNIWMKNCKCAGNKQDIPLSTSFAAGRNLIDYLTLAATYTPAFQVALTTAYAALIVDLEGSFNSYIFTTGTVPTYMANSSGKSDCSSYGIVLSPDGEPFTSPLVDRDNDSNEITNIYMENVSVNKVDANIVEIVSLVNSAGVVTDPSGFPLRWIEISTVGTSTWTAASAYTYTGNNLSHTQIELARYVAGLTTLEQATFDQLNIDAGVIAWKDTVDNSIQISGNDAVVYYRENILQINAVNITYETNNNTDGFGHVNKGTIGFKIDGANTMCMINCQANNILNSSAVGSVLFGSYIYGSTSQTGSQIGYLGDKSYGFLLSGTNDMKLKNICASTIKSTYSTAIGFRLQNDSQNIEVINLRVKNISSAVGQTLLITQPFLPNMFPNSYALYIDNTSFNIKMKQFNYSNILNNSVLNLNDPVHLGILINEH